MKHNPTKFNVKATVEASGSIHQVPVITGGARRRSRWQLTGTTETVRSTLKEKSKCGGHYCARGAAFRYYSDFICADKNQAVLLGSI